MDDEDDEDDEDNESDEGAAEEGAEDPLGIALAFEDPAVPAAFDDDVQPATTSAIAAISVAAAKRRRTPEAGMIKSFVLRHMATATGGLPGSSGVNRD